MIEQKIRHVYQKIAVEPIALLLKNHLSPNTITIFSGIFGFLVFPALYFKYIVVAIILLLLSGYCDTLDGTLARNTNNKSAFGSVLDIMMDRFVEFVVVFSLFSIDPTHRAIMCLIMLGSMFLCISSFLVVGIFTENNTHKSFHYSPGIVERAEAFIFFIAMMIFPEFFNVFAILFSVLVMLTTLIRLYQFYKQCTYIAQ